MDRLKALVLRLANADRVGGRVVVMDGRTLILYDCMHWGCSCTETVLSLHPEAQISVHACRQSLSGFSVTFRVDTSPRRELAWCLVIGLVFACCCYVLYMPPRWGAYLRGL